jgi:hypothetical protein
MNKREIRNCKKHGNYEHVLEKNGYFRCKRCRNDAVIQRRKDVKRQLVDMLGGKCQRCGYNKCIEALDFHHRNPEEKSFSISQQAQSTFAIAKFIEEVKKCELVCANCHREIENNII